MASQKIVVCDTNIVIEYLKRNLSVMNEMEKIGYENLAVSAITIGEMYFGAINKQELSKIKNRIEKFIPLPITEDTTTIFIDLMHSNALAYKLSIPDALIAATAIANKFDLYTLNQKDFVFLKQLKLYNH